MQNNLVFVNKLNMQNWVRIYCMSLKLNVYLQLIIAVHLAYVFTVLWRNKKYTGCNYCGIYSSYYILGRAHKVKLIIPH